METKQEPVQTWRQLTSIYVGGAVCLPVIVIGQDLCQRYGFLPALFAIVIGNGLLLFLGLAASAMSTSSRKSTSQHAEDYFGKKGAKVFALVIIASMLSWFAIQLNMMTLSLVEIGKLVLPYAPSSTLINIGLGVGMTVLARKGMSALRLLSDISFPILIVTMVWAVMSAEPPTIPAMQEGTFNLGGISLVMAASIAVVIDTPTFFRYAKSGKDGFITTLLLFCLALPLIEGVGVYLASSMPGASILDTLKGTQGGPLWNLWVALFLLLAGWTTNNTNLYSAVASSELLHPQATLGGRTLALGAVGTLLACADPLQHIEGIITLLGIAMGSMGGVMLTSYLLDSQKGKNTPVHLVCWGLGFSLGGLTLMDFLWVTGIPLFDAYLGASAAYLIIKKFKRGVIRSCTQ